MSYVLRLTQLTVFIILVVATFRATVVFKPESQSLKSCIETTHHHKIDLKNDPAILRRFMGALNIPSISYKIHTYDGPQMKKIIDYIQVSE